MRTPESTQSELAGREERRLVIRATTLTIEEAGRIEEEAQTAGMAVADYVRFRLLRDSDDGSAGEVTLSTEEASRLVELLRIAIGGDEPAPPSGETRVRLSNLAEALEHRLGLRPGV